MYPSWLYGFKILLNIGKKVEIAIKLPFVCIITSPFNCLLYKISNNTFVLKRLITFDEKQLFQTYFTLVLHSCKNAFVVHCFFCHLLMKFLKEVLIISSILYSSYLEIRIIMFAIMLFTNQLMTSCWPKEISLAVFKIMFNHYINFLACFQHYLGCLKTTVVPKQLFKFSLKTFIFKRII